MHIAKWRVDDQSIPDNQEWRLQVYDRNQGKWVAVSGLGPDESAVIKILQVEEE